MGKEGLVPYHMLTGQQATGRLVNKLGWIHGVRGGSVFGATNPKYGNE